MGYGCFNASGLSPDSNPKTLTIDYAYTSEEEFAEMKCGDLRRKSDFQLFSADENRDEFEYLSATIVQAGQNLKKQGFKSVTTYDVDDRSKVYAPHGDRYQNLSIAFELDSVGVYWQAEPFMGWALCIVIAPRYQMELQSDVWGMEDEEFKATYGMTVDRYKDRAEALAADVINYVIAWMEEHANAVTAKRVSTGFGYTRHYGGFIDQLVPLKSAIWTLAKRTLSTADRRHLKPAVGRGRMIRDRSPVHPASR